MLELAPYRRAMPFRGMASPVTAHRIPEQQLLGFALRSMRKRADLTQAQAADKAGLHEATWRRYEKGQRGVPLEDLIAAAEAIGFSRDDLLDAREEIAATPSANVIKAVVRHRTAPAKIAADEGMTIRDHVQAGAWLESDDMIQLRPRRHPVARSPRYPHAEQWLDEVVGDSVDRLFIFHGDLVHLVSAIDAGYRPKTNDIVEVERIRFGGQLRELTLKQVEVTSDGTVKLWPRSNNPSWQEPVQLLAGVANDEDVEVRIRAFVIQSIRRFD